MFEIEFDQRKIDIVCAIPPCALRSGVCWGRSMGSGPTSYLASKKYCHSILLMSPFMSIKDAAKDLLGWGGFISYFAIERFRNIDYISQAKCPCFFMHGIKDTLIPFDHSV